MAGATDRRAAAGARHRLLPGGRGAGPMPWIIAIMMFLTVLAAAAGLGIGAAVQSMSADLAGRASVQIVEADAQARGRMAARVLTMLRGADGVRTATPVDPAVLADQLRKLPICAACSRVCRPSCGSNRTPPSCCRLRVCCPRSAGWRRGSCC